MRDQCQEAQVLLSFVYEMSKCSTDIESCRMLANAHISDSSTEKKITLGRRELFQVFFLTAAASSLGAGPNYSAAEVHND